MLTYVLQPNNSQKSQQHRDGLLHLLKILIQMCKKYDFTCNVIHSIHSYLKV